MRKIDNWSELKTTTDEVMEFDKLPIGPQYCKVIDVQDVEDKEYLKLMFDIVKGDFKDVFKDQEERFGNWPSQGMMYRSYKVSAEKFFAAFITAIEKSNDGFTFNPNLDWCKQINGKYFVGNFAEEEYLDGDEIKTSLKVREVRSIQALKEGKVKELTKKLLPAELQNLSLIKVKDVNSVEDDLPF